MTTGQPPMLSVFVEGKPISVNAAYGLRGRTHPPMVARPTSHRKRPKAKFLTEEALAWRDSVSYITQVMLGNRSWRPTGPQVEVHCTLYGVRGDADNYAKLLLDGLKYALHLDDRYFNPVVMAKAPRIKGEPPQGARIEIWDRAVVGGAATAAAGEKEREADGDVDRTDDSRAHRVGRDADREAPPRTPRARRAGRATGTDDDQPTARTGSRARGTAVGARATKRAG